MAGAFAAGEGDFTTGFEPTGISMEKSNTGYVVKSIGEAVGKVPYTTYSATNSFIKENKELIQRFTNAVYKGQQWIKNSSDEEVAKAMKPFFNEISIDDLVKEANELDKEPPFEKIVNNSFAKNSINNVK